MKREPEEGPPRPNGIVGGEAQTGMGPVMFQACFFIDQILTKELRIPGLGHQGHHGYAFSLDTEWEFTEDKRHYYPDIRACVQEQPTAYRLLASAAQGYTDFEGKAVCLSLL